MDLVSSFEIDPAVTVVYSLDTNQYLFNFTVPAKRRKCRPPTAEEEETTAMDAAAAGAVWTPRPLNDLKISSIYNRSATEAPAEVSLKHSCGPFDWS